MRTKFPNSKVQITVAHDPNIQSLMEAIRTRDTTSVTDAIHTAAMRLGLTLFARSPESLARALEREHHRSPLEADALNERTVKELAKALELPSQAPEQVSTEARAFRVSTHRTGAICDECHRPKDPEPMVPLQAAYQRVGLSTARSGHPLGDEKAYCLAKSTVLVGWDREDFCSCDLANWEAAQQEYHSKGAKACWAALGVTDQLMQEAMGGLPMRSSERPANMMGSNVRRVPRHA